MYPGIEPTVRGAGGSQGISPSASPLSCQSCYEHIQKEDMRLHRFPGRWDSREHW